MWPVSCASMSTQVTYVTCVDILVQVSLTPRSIFLFLDVATRKLRIIIIILTTNQPHIILPTARTTKLPSPKAKL